MHRDVWLVGALVLSSIDINAVYTHLGATDPGTHRSLFSWATALSCSVTARWTLEGELSGMEQKGAPRQAQFLGAVSYAAAPTVVLDAGGLAGLDHAAPRYGLFAGLTVLVR